MGAAVQEHVISAATHHHRNDLNIYEGRRIKGYVETTISRWIAAASGLLELPLSFGA